MLHMTKGKIDRMPEEEFRFWMARMMMRKTPNKRAEEQRAKIGQKWVGGKMSDFLPWEEPNPEPVARMTWAQTKEIVNASIKAWNRTK